MKRLDSPKGLSLQNDGFNEYFLTFRCKDGSVASISLMNTLHGPLARDIIARWAKEQLEEIEENK